MFTVQAVIAQGSDSSLANFLRREEGLHLSVYLDGGHRAVGYGHRINKEDADWLQQLRVGDSISEEVAELLLQYDLCRIVQTGLLLVKKEIGCSYPPNVYEALGSLIYNMGYRGLTRTLFYRSFREKDYIAAFVILPSTAASSEGLRLRRERERLLLMRHFCFSERRYHP